MSDTRNIIDKIESGDFADAVSAVQSALYARAVANLEGQGQSEEIEEDDSEDQDEEL